MDVSIDKRDVAYVFRARMALLIAQRGHNLSQFSQSVGIDRSALSQFLAPDSTRLPRIETLCVIAKSCGVSLDWLMGLVANDSSRADNIPSMEVMRLSGDVAEQKIAEWHREAGGYKIRYVPCTIPDILRIQDVTDYEFTAHNHEIRVVEASLNPEEFKKATYLETDVEVCVAQQTIENLALGQGVWRGLDEKTRQKQLEHMINLIDEYYPTFRMFIYDELDTYSSPYTLFGPQRAAIYMGSMYLVVNSVEHIKAMSQHFDRLIRAAIVPPDRIADYISKYLK